MENEPLGFPPPGVVPNFEHPETRAPAIYITAGVCISLILVFATLRLHAKMRIFKFKAWDDVTCMLGIATSLSYISITIVAVASGVYGVHQWELQLKDFTTEALVISLIVEVIYGPIIWFIKLSLFVLYLEIFGRLKWLRYLAIGGSIFTGLFYFATMCAFAIMCSPYTGTGQFDYLAALASPKCELSRPLVIVQGAVNIASDLFLLVLPLPAVWSLKLAPKKKLAVSAVFATGLVACIASMIGLKFRIDINSGYDNTWTVIPVWLTTIIEMTAGILVCCMPTTAAVFKKLKTPVTNLLATFTMRTASNNQHTESETHMDPAGRPGLALGKPLDNEVYHGGRQHSHDTVAGSGVSKMTDTYSRTIVVTTNQRSPQA